jgi:hypothetical protein
VKLDSLADFLRLAGPLLLLGFVAGALRAAAAHVADPRTRRLLAFSWVALLLFGGPLWLFLAATLKLL